ncbi:unnamed protein product [Phytomonas sp. Hart1]|nr:unnamed protein product [Phytomonas sp. Hart1]|eukprot:CCW70780.1 unnamed protein product [Phytomonas sp. isolate Hart1]
MIAKHFPLILYTIPSRDSVTYHILDADQMQIWDKYFRGACPKNNLNYTDEADATCTRIIAKVYTC